MVRLYKCRGKLIMILFFFCVYFSERFSESFSMSFVITLFKRNMPSQAHARVDEKHFEIVRPTFSNTVGEFRKLFSSV